MPAPLALPDKIKGVIFDCDGVIIDSRVANRLYFNKFLEYFNLPALTKEQESFTFMATVDESLNFIIPKQFHEEMHRERANIVSYQRDIMSMVELNAHFEDFARWLLSHNIPCAVHTNRSTGMKYVADKFPVLQEFSPIVTALTVKPKPDPEGVLYILQKWNVQAQDIIFIGDSFTDQQAAAGAGVPFVLYGHEKLDASLQSDNFITLQDTLAARILA